MASLRLATLLVALSILFTIPYSPHPSLGDTPPVISIFNENTKSNITADPSLTVGKNFTIDVRASNLPSITSQTSGGLEGFDISLSYDPNILKTSSLSFKAPLCSSSDGCVFDLPANDTLTYANSASAIATARLAMISLGANHRAVDSSQTGIPTILFRAKFLVVGKGLTPITIQSGSQLLGFANNFCTLASSTFTSGSFDNRPPYTVTATPPSLTVSAGMSVSTTINVTATRGSEIVNATLLVSGLVLESHSTYTLIPRSAILSPTNPSFTSTLTITTQATSIPQTYPLEIIAAEPPPLDESYNEFRLPFNLTMTAPGASLPTQPQNSPIPPQPRTTLPREQATDGSTPPLLVTFTFSSGPTVGKPVSFSSTIWCGTAPYSYSWTLGDGSMMNSSLVTHTYSLAGTYNVTLTATDATGQKFSSSQLIVVGALPQPAAPLDIGVVSVAIILVLLLILVGSSLSQRSRRKSRR